MVDRALDRLLQQLRRVAAQIEIGLPLEHVIGDLVGGVELCAIDRGERLEVALVRRLVRGLRLIGEEVAEPVGIAQVAAHQRLDRLALEHRLIAVMEELEQPGILGRGGGLAESGRGEQGRREQHRE